MDKSLPDKWVRKAISAVLNDIIVDGIKIPIYDTRVTTNQNKDIPQHYILMTTQTNEVDKNNKCEWFWDSSILLDIITSYDLPGNPGSRLLADNILDAARNATNNLVLDVASGLEIIIQTLSIPNDISVTTHNENIFRKLIRLELKIK